MEDLITQLIDTAKGHLLIVYFVSFMAIAYRYKNPLYDLMKKKVPKAWVVFIIGTLVAVPYWFWLKEDRMQLFFTFTFATSFFELLIKPIVKKFKMEDGSDGSN
jgi:amino acid transporter